MRINWLVLYLFTYGVFGLYWTTHGNEGRSIWSEESLHSILLDKKTAAEVESFIGGETRYDGYSVSHFIFVASGVLSAEDLRDTVLNGIAHKLDESGLFVWTKRTPKPPPSLTYVYSSDVGAGNISAAFISEDSGRVTIVFFATDIDYSRPLRSPEKKCNSVRPNSLGNDP